MPVGLVTPPLNRKNPSEAFKIAAFRHQYAALPAALRSNLRALVPPKDARAAARFPDLVATEGGAGLVQRCRPSAPGPISRQAGGLAPGEVIGHWLAGSALVLGRWVVEAAPMAAAGVGFG